MESCFANLKVIVEFSRSTRSNFSEDNASNFSPKWLSGVARSLESMGNALLNCLFK